MKHAGAMAPTKTHLHILLADDDEDDRYFFERALSVIPIPTRMTTVGDGEKLMVYLAKHAAKLPDILFLDLNMPRKNGLECLQEIEHNEKLKQLPIIIYSTSLPGEAADILYNLGAYYYVRKTDTSGLKKILHHILLLLVENKFVRASRESFIFSLSNVATVNNPN
jgi:CheY-like chemotaxis protein